MINFFKYFIVIPKQLNNWSTTHTWVSYSLDKKAVICSICSEAIEKKLPVPTSYQSKNSKKAFVDTGFRTWSNALTAFRNHEVSELHRNALFLLQESKKETVVEKISCAHKKQMLENRTALHAIFTSIKFLIRQGLALRGKEDHSSNLHQLLLVRSQDIPALNSWMQRSGYKWLHNSSVNEIIQFFADEIRSIILAEIKRADFYGILMDETADLSKTEQVSLCVRTVEENLMICENFMGFYKTCDTKSKTLFELLKNFLDSQTLKINKIRGQCYDGAQNMSGKITGLQTRVKEVEPRAIYVHCSAHCLSLVVQDSIEGIATVKNLIGVLKEMIKFVHDSPKRFNEFKTLQEKDQDNDSPILTPFCPTRYANSIIKYNLFY